MGRKNTSKLQTFLSAIAQCNEQQLEEFFGALLTESERKDIPKRLEIVRLLREGVPQREIADRLGVGIATVTRGAKIANEPIFDVISVK